LQHGFPALRSLEQTPNNLPSQLTSLVGRESELHEIDRLLPDHRLVTVVGTAGSGKTRCAIQAGAELLDRFIDGVWLVELAPIADPALVTAAMTQALGVNERPGRPLLETLLAHLERRHALIVIDNCEHVIDEVRRVVAATLRACADVRVLATSREALSIAGEHALRLGSLPLPPARKVAVLACMDARLDPQGLLGLREGDAHVIRNAGGRASDDAIRSLAISQRLLGTAEIVLIHHTGCGMLSCTDEEFKAAIEREPGVKPACAAESFSDLEGDVRQSIARVEASPFLPHNDSVRGFVYEVESGRLREVV